MVMILIKTPDEWATTKQACLVELEVRIFFLNFFSSALYTSFLFYVLSTVLLKLNFAPLIILHCGKIKEDASIICDSGFRAQALGRQNVVQLITYALIYKLGK